MRYRKGFFGVVYFLSNNRISYLILKRKLHWKGWEFPKGGVENKESMKEAVYREIKEETGLKPVKIVNHRISGRFRYSKQFKDRPEFIGQSYALYSIRVENKKVMIDRREHSDYRWVGFPKAVKALRFSNQRRCLRQVNKMLEEENAV